MLSISFFVAEVIALSVHVDPISVSSTYIVLGGEDSPSTIAAGTRVPPTDADGWASKKKTGQVQPLLVVEQGGHVQR